MCEGSSPDVCVLCGSVCRTWFHISRGGGVTDTFRIFPLVDQNVMIYDLCKTKAEGIRARGEWITIINVICTWNADCNAV